MHFFLSNVKMHRRYPSLPPSPHQDHQDSNSFDDKKTMIFIHSQGLSTMDISMKFDNKGLVVLHVAPSLGHVKVMSLVM